MKKATREAYGVALAELGKSNDKIVALDADLSGSTKSADFKNVTKRIHHNSTTSRLSQKENIT